MNDVFILSRRTVLGSLPWAVLFAAAFLARTAYDWFVPTTDFHTRSLVTTLVAVGILLLAGCRAAWRDRSFLAGTLDGVTITLIAAIISMIGTALLFAVWHDEQTLAAIRGSGGLDEVFVLPVLLVIPGLVVGTVGGAIGALLVALIHPRRLAS